MRMTYIVSPLAGLGGGHIVAAARLQLISVTLQSPQYSSLINKMTIIILIRNRYITVFSGHGN